MVWFMGDGYNVWVLVYWVVSGSGFFFIEISFFVYKRKEFD